MHAGRRSRLPILEAGRRSTAQVTGKGLSREVLGGVLFEKSMDCPAKKYCVGVPGVAVGGP